MKGVREIDFGYRPLQVHVPFHESRARYKCAIGGLGSGKSLALCAEAIAFALEQPGSHMVLTRRYVPHLRDSTEQIFFNLLPSALRDAGQTLRMGGHYDSYTFPNGSKMLFRGLEDWTKYKSTEFAWIGFDEVDEQVEAQVSGLTTRLRQTAPLREAIERGYRKPRAPMRQQACMASNPAGKNWVWRAFVNPETAWADSSVHLSTSLDNPYLPGTYLDDLMGRPLAFVRRYVLTQFDNSAGQCFETWNWAEHIVEPPRAGHAFPIWQGMDPGMSNQSPCAALWVVADRPTGRLIGVHEYQESNLAAHEHMRRWREIEKGMLPSKVRVRIADPKISARDHNAKTLEDLYRKGGFSFRPGALRHSQRIPMLDELIRTGRFVLTENCPQTFEQIAAARWEDQLPQHMDAGEFREVVKKGEDHLCDAAQYLAGKWLDRVPAYQPATVDEDMYTVFTKDIKRRIDEQARRPATMGARDGEIV